jgi:hypothetical protein
MSFPKKGNKFPARGEPPIAPAAYASAIQLALRRQLGSTHQAVKIAVRWTGANERTVKNWFSGIHGPSGEHLVSLIRHSDPVFEAVLHLAGRRQDVLGHELSEVRATLLRMVGLIDAMTNS